MDKLAFTLFYLAIDLTGVVVKPLYGEANRSMSSIFISLSSYYILCCIKELYVMARGSLISRSVLKKT